MRWKTLVRASRKYDGFMESVVASNETKSLDLLKDFGEGVILAEVVPSGKAVRETYLNPENTSWKIIWNVGSPDTFREQVFYRKQGDMNVFKKSDQLIRLGSEKLNEYLGEMGLDKGVKD